jgi:hypothetical protein
MNEKLAFVLMMKILDVVSHSGANEREARSALSAAEAMLPEVDLQAAPTLTIET